MRTHTGYSPHDNEDDGDGMMDDSAVGIATICSGIAAILGVLATKGVDGINKWRKGSDDSATEGYKVALDDLRLRVAALELALSSSERGHRECLEKQARMSVTVQFMQAEIDEMKGKK